MKQSPIIKNKNFAWNFNLLLPKKNPNFTSKIELYMKNIKRNKKENSSKEKLKKELVKSQDFKFKLNFKKKFKEIFNANNKKYTIPKGKSPIDSFKRSAEDLLRSWDVLISPNS